MLINDFIKILANTLFFYFNTFADFFNALKYYFLFFVPILDNTLIIILDRVIYCFYYFYGVFCTFLG